MTKKQKIKNNVIGAMKLHTHPWIILIKSMIVGALAGAIASFYRYVVSHVENINNFIYGFLRHNNKFIPIAIIAIILISLLVGFISKTFKMIGGSGIPQVKGIISGYFNDTWLSTLIAKFIAGAISIGAGLSLGREGPSIQMGANIADGFGRKFGKSRHERRILIAAGAGAGLAAAFGAPLAGVMFVLEEIFRYLSTTMLLAVCVAALAADYVSKVIFGMAPVFNFPISELLPLKFYWLLPILGIVTGLA
ncbi:MAG: chloride channel protein, partial [Lachnospiraceae bacterium]|nr:chloride channel protein [Lachnospiraceae bacterium]